MFKQWLKKFKKFYNSSAENRIQIYLFLGFMVIPIIGMSLLYICVYHYLWK